MKYLIVTADDFGLSEGVNRGIIEAAEHGIVTSASLMVRQPAACAAATYAKKSERLSIGLHLDLGEWIYRNGQWVNLYSVVPTHDPIAVAEEVACQLKQFQDLLGRDPTHLDSHQHVHREEPVRTVMLELAGRLDVPLRECTPGIHYCGDFYGQTGEGETLPDSLSVDALKSVLRTIHGPVTELGCHPGYGEGLASTYQSERATEVETLCVPAVRHTLDALGIQLCSFHTLPDWAWQRSPFRQHS
jgi:predicted glycoside hydrolase/deacetylase ChbG (UPF0249 family)